MEGKKKRDREEKFIEGSEGEGENCRAKKKSEET